MLNETQSQQIFFLMYRHGLTNFKDTKAKAGGVLGLRQMNTCRKAPLAVKFLDDDILHCLLWVLSFYLYRKHKEKLIQWVPDTVSLPELDQRCLLLKITYNWEKAEVTGAQVHRRSPLLCRLMCIAIESIFRRLLPSIRCPSFEPHNVDRQESM